MNWTDNISAVVTLVGSIATAGATIVGVWMTVAKHHNESNRERAELIKAVKESQDTLAVLVKEVADIKEQNLLQQEEIESAMDFSKSHFRMSLYNNITKALERGYTTIGEATELTKMYAIYTKHGGNGEIELLFKKFDKLEIMEDDFYETKQPSVR